MIDAHRLVDRSQVPLIAAAAVVVALSTAIVLSPVLAVAAIATMLIVWSLAVRVRTSTVTAVWLVCVVTFPPWIYLAVGPLRVDIAAVVSLTALILIAPGTRAFKFHSMDIAILLLGLTLTFAVLVGMPAFLAAQGLLNWVIVYSAGRLIAHRLTGEQISQIAAWVACVLSVLAIVQVVSGINVADLIPPNEVDYGSGAQWTVLQLRGDAIRAELAFGHSIALGGTLALLLPFALYRRGLLGATVVGILITLGILATQSRAALAAALIALALSAATTPRLARGGRAILVTTGLGAVVVTLPLIVDQFVFGGSDANSEVFQGTNYRVDLLQLISQVVPLGPAQGASVGADGATLTWGSAVSIDNGLLYVGLYVGAIAAAIYFAPTLYAVLRIKTRGPAVVAIVSQIPLLLTVAPITQYQAMYWAVVGILVTQASSQKDGRFSEGDT